VDLVSGVFRFGKFADDEGRAADGIDFLCVAEGLFEAEKEDLLQHFDHVVVAVIVIVEQDDAIERGFAGFANRFPRMCVDGEK
jgi:hypothetical protein